MKRLFLLCLLLSTISAMAQTNPSFGTYCADGDSCSLTSVAGASVVISDSNFNPVGATATLNGAGVPIFFKYPTIWDGGTATSTAWIAPNVAAGTNAVAITHSGGDHFNTMQAISVTGTATINPTEYNTTPSVTGTSSTCTGTVTTTHPNDLIVGFINAAGAAVVSLGTSTQTMTLASGSGGNVGAAYGVLATAGTATVVWNITGGGQWVCDVFAFKPAPATEPTVSSVAVTPVSPSVVANVHVTLTATATYSDGGLRDVSQAATWASSNTSVATITSAGIVNPQSTGTTNVTATYGSVTSPNDLVTVTPYTPVPWFVRPDGGTRYSSTGLTSGQCDGLGDLPYPGTGINQHCAYNDVRFLYSDGVNTGQPVWVIASSDIVTIRGSIADGVTYRIGYQALNSPCGSGLCFGISGDVGDSGVPTPPAGSASQHTIIQGGNAGSCHNPTARTQLHGGFGIGSVVSFYGTQNITLSCFDLTDWAVCGVEGGGATPPAPQCKSGGVAIADYAATGIHLHYTSTGITLEDINIHGLGASGLAGSTGDDFTADYIELVGNQTGGWQADDADGTTGVGSALITHYVIGWNGCLEQFPIVDPVPYVYCYDQGFNVGGDGFGTATLDSPSPGWQVHFDQGQVYYNTQDGLDALHIGGPGSTMTVTRTRAYGNEGQQLKVGGAVGHIANNVIFGNCNALGNVQMIPTNGDTVSVTSNVATFSQAFVSNLNTYLAPGMTVTFSALQTAAGLNGTTAVISAVTASSVSVPWVHADMAAAAESGIITLPIPGRPIPTNDAVGGGYICRADDTAVLVNVTPGDITTFQDNTIYSNNAIALEIEYANGADEGSTNVAQYNNNVFIGFVGTNGALPSPIYSNTDLNMLTNPGASWTHNSYLGNKWTCPQVSESNALCTTPGLVNQTMPTLSTVNTVPASGTSAVVGTGVAIGGITVDYNGATRPNPPAIGANEFAAPSPVTHLTVGNSTKFGNVISQ